MQLSDMNKSSDGHLEGKKVIILNLENLWLN